MPHILVVEEDIAVADIISKTLLASDHRVAHAHDGNSLRGCLENGTKIDAVVLDPSVLGGRGREIARHLGALDIPVVICAGSSRERRAALVAGLRTLRKPTRCAELGEALAAVLLASSMSSCSTPA